MLALSTSWNALQYTRAKDIIKEIKSLGFERVELNFNLTSKLVEEMLKLQNEGVIKVVSLHNFCPIPEKVSRQKALPDFFSLSSLDEEERKLALRYTKRTIETAARFSAQAVVLHCGKVQVEEKIRQLAGLFQKKDQAAGQKLKQRMFEEREARAKQFFQQTLKSLDELCAYALKQGVNLGLENRYYFSEIPTSDEMETILAAFPGPPLYYWHDVGHAQVHENLGLFEHKMMLDKFGPRLFGMHLHDVEGIDDHRAPLSGKFDFSRLLPYVQKNTLKVMEPHRPASAPEIIRGKQYLEKLFGD